MNDSYGRFREVLANGHSRPAQLVMLALESGLVSRAGSIDQGSVGSFHTVTSNETVRASSSIAAIRT
jgi:hypothetical protein